MDAIPRIFQKSFGEFWKAAATFETPLIWCQRWLIFCIQDQTKRLAEGRGLGGWRHSSEVTSQLRTQQPQVLFSAFPIFSMLLRFVVGTVKYSAQKLVKSI